MSDNKQKSTLLKDAIILFVITIIAAFALGAVYEITKDPIAEAEAKAKTASSPCKPSIAFSSSSLCSFKA